MDRKTIIRKLKNFKRQVGKDLPLDKVIFFGSRVRGKPQRYSDIDLIIVSPKFKQLDFVERGVKMYDYWDLGYPVDFLCYTPEEFKKLSNQITLVSAAVKEGIAI